MPKRKLIAVLVALAAGAGGDAASSTAHSDRPSISVQEVACLPLEANRAVRVTVEGMPASASLRLYFRRLHPLGAFYYTRTRPSANGSWWTVFPKPEDRKQHQLTDEWWKVLATRDWIVLEERDREWLEAWLGERRYEAGEYYAAIHDASGELIERSETRLVEVLEAADCEAPLDPVETGWARNLTVGETTDLQAGKPLFHWLCDGVVTRISAPGILGPDGYCRACVVASTSSGGTVRRRPPGRSLIRQPSTAGDLSR